MADPAGDAPESWSVPQRPAFVAAVLVPLVLLGIVLVAGRAYDRYLRPAHLQPVTAFPAPGIETYIHDGKADPVRPARHVAPEPAIGVAKRQMLRDGLAGWGARP